jgi:hypothetical protein
MWANWLSMIYDIGEGMGPVYREKDLNPNWETRNP